MKIWQTKFYTCNKILDLKYFSATIAFVLYYDEKYSVILRLGPIMFVVTCWINVPVNVATAFSVFIPDLEPIFNRWEGLTYSLINQSSAGNHMFKVNNRNRTRCELCLKLTIKIPERRHWRPSGVCIVNFEHVSHFFLMFPLLTLNK